MPIHLNCGMTIHLNSKFEATALNMGPVAIAKLYPNLEDITASKASNELNSTPSKACNKLNLRMLQNSPLQT